MRGQAALEYLFNYGFAILLLAIVMGIALYLGIFNPNSISKENCYLGPNFDCYSEITTSNSTILYFKIKNKMPYTIKMEKIQFVSEDINKTLPLAFELKSGEEKIINTSLNYISPGKTEKISLYINYYSCAEEINPACEKTNAFLREASGYSSLSVLKSE